MLFSSRGETIAQADSSLIHLGAESPQGSMSGKHCGWQEGGRPVNQQRLTKLPET
jgi:hypothetical protein